MLCLKVCALNNPREIIHAYQTMIKNVLLWEELEERQVLVSVEPLWGSSKTGQFKVTSINMEGGQTGGSSLCE